MVNSQSPNQHPRDSVHLAVMADASAHGFGSILEHFLNSVIDRTQVFLNYDTQQEQEHESNVVTHSCLLEKTVSLIETLVEIQRLGAMEETSSDLDMLLELKLVFSRLHEIFSNTFTNATYLSTPLSQSSGPGRPSYKVPAELLEELRGMGLSWKKIAAMFGVSRWTIARRVQEYGLGHLAIFSDITDNQLDNLIRGFIERHGLTTGEPYLRGHIRALGYHVQRHRIRESITRVDPRNTALRWGALVARRTYYVPWVNSLWHIDGHHSLIRWGIVVHGCIDGKSRRIIFLRASNNNLSATVLKLFEDAIQRDGGFWPSRIRVDFGVENTAICDAMVVHNGAGRGSFVCGSSTRNQRIERLWRDVFRCVCHIYYYTFYAMEQSGLLDVENTVHLFALQSVFTPRINYALNEWMACHNNHPLSTEHGCTPNEIWLRGMANPANPLANGCLDDNPTNLAYYGEDPGGPSPFEQTENNVVVEPAQLTITNAATEFARAMQNFTDTTRISLNFGIDIYVEALEFINHTLQQEINQ